jgi:hypothetical protein
VFKRSRSLSAQSSTSSSGHEKIESLTTLEELEKAGESIRCVWDGSVIEKPESEHTEGMCAVRSSKARRLKKQRKGNWKPPGGKAITVLAMEWITLLVLGMKGIPEVAPMGWWTEPEGKEVGDIERVGMKGSKKEERDKLLLMVTLVYAYLLCLVDPRHEHLKEWLLRNYCHRTGKRYRKAKFPRYRLRWALSRFYQDGHPMFSHPLFAGHPGESNIRSETPG